MSDSDQDVISEAAEEAVGLGSHAGKTVVQEFGKIAGGVVSATLGKKPKTPEEIAALEAQEKMQKQAKIQAIKQRLALAQQQQKQKAIAPQPQQPQLPKPVQQIQRLQSPPAIAKTRTELKGGWGAG
jgi:hypothetical protein